MKRANNTLAAHQPNCFGCGPENPAGLKVRARVEGDRVHAEVTFSPHHEGSPGFAHGGAVAAALDDVFGFVLVVVERPAVTASLTVDYRAPARLGRPLRMEARCERIEGRKLHMRATISDEQLLVAEARAIFVAVELEHFAKSGQPVPESWMAAWG